MPETGLPRVLCVDDEPNLLAALERLLGDRFEITTACSGAEALERVNNDGPFEAVMSDMRMPGIDGATFLARVRLIAPDTVRLLLTGQADLDSAIAAINHGAIFRFLSKPCPREVLVEALEEAVRKHRVVRLERELLETTLAGAVKTLTEVLAMAAPWAFQRAAVALGCVRHALTRLRWPDGWMYEVAAALSQIGCVGVPQDALQRDAAQRQLSMHDAEVLAGHPEIGYKLLASIPRLEMVAEMIRYQASTPPEDARPEVVRGVELLRAALVVEQHVARGSTLEVVGAALRATRPELSADVIGAVIGFRADFSESRAAFVRDLRPGWVLEEDVLSRGGVLVLSKGHELTEAAIIALSRMHDSHAIEEPIRVRHQCASGEQGASDIRFGAGVRL